MLDLLFFNLKISLIFSLYPGKFIKFNQSEWFKQITESGKFEILRAIGIKSSRDI